MKGKPWYCRQRWEYYNYLLSFLSWLLIDLIDRTSCRKLGKMLKVELENIYPETNQTLRPNHRTWPKLLWHLGMYLTCRHTLVWVRWWWWFVLACLGALDTVYHEALRLIFSSPPSIHWVSVVGKMKVGWGLCVPPRLPLQCELFRVIEASFLCCALWKLS